MESKNKLDILLVNPHLEFPSDTSGRSSLYRKTEHLLNMGLLSIATYLKNLDIQVEILDLSMEKNPMDALKILVEKHEPRFIGISNQSCHSYLSTIQCVNLVKSINPTTQVIVGGLHASGIPDLMLSECRSIDTIIVGEGELPLAYLLRGITGMGRVIHHNFHHQFVIDLNELVLDYTLYPRYEDFVPYVEESRGCAGKCSYCISPLVNRRKIRVRQPTKIAKDVKALSKLYGPKGFHFYIEANTFGTNHANVTDLTELLTGSKFSWRTETRADTFPVHLLDPLVDAGLKVLDIGLESASPEILFRMKKTRCPDAYLRKGLRLAEKIAKNGKCILKLNIMLFYGETKETINETRDYIRTISSICPVSLGIGPARMDPGSEMYQKFVDNADLSEFDGTFWGRVHCYPVNLSGEISFQDANQICLEISQEFQTSRTYYEAKRHSQLPYGMTYEEFMKASELIPRTKRQWSD